MFVKPRAGSASVNAFKATTLKELEFFAEYVPEAIVQEFVSGQEYTVDVFSDWSGQPIAAIAAAPACARGEVLVGRIEHQATLEEQCKQIARDLGTVGPINVQAIVADGRFWITEINPRFGGGCPLSIAAGAPLCRWAVRLALHLDLPGEPWLLKEGLTMMRFDDSLLCAGRNVAVIAAIAFDLDDTLFPEEQFVRSGYRAVSQYVRARFGWEIFDELVHRFESGQSGDLFTPVLAERLGSVEESFIRELVQVYRAHEPCIETFPDCRGVLECLRRRYALAIISDGWLAVQQRKLDALKISDYFSAVIFSDLWGREYWKPHARPYTACAEALALEPKTLVYVGDNPAKDFITARQLQIATVRIRRPGTLHFSLQLDKEHEADHELSSLDELAPLLDSIATARLEGVRTGRSA